MYSHSSVMDSVSKGCVLETRLVHMPVMLVTNVHPDVIKANRPYGVTLLTDAIIVLTINYEHIYIVVYQPLLSHSVLLLQNNPMEVLNVVSLVLSAVED